MLILALDSALARCSAGLLRDDDLVASRHEDLERGQAARLPLLTMATLEDAGISPSELDLIVVTLGPGSFTGIRAGLGLAHGLALAVDRPLVGVTIGEALAPALPKLGARELWTAVDSRRGRVFLEQNGQITACLLSDLPAPVGPVAVGGDAAPPVAAHLAARGFDVMLTDARLPSARHVAIAGRGVWQSGAARRPVQPLYIDPPVVKLQAGGLRPPPVAA